MAFCVLNASITVAVFCIITNKVHKYLCIHLYVISVKNEMDTIVHICL